MSLRSRLTLLVALTIIVPITAVGVTVGNLIGSESEDRTFDRLRQSAGFAAAALADEAAVVKRTIPPLVTDPRLTTSLASGGAVLDQELRRILTEEDLDVVVIADASGAVVAGARREADFAASLRAPPDATLVSDLGKSLGFLSAVALPEGGRLVGGRWHDNRRLGRIARSDEIAITLVDGRRIVATTTPIDGLPRRPLEGAFEASFGGSTRLAVASESEAIGLTVLVSALPSATEGRVRVILLFGGLLLVLIVLIVLVGHQVSGLVTGPVENLVAAAGAVSRGDLTQRVEPSGDLELANLGRAFNQMTDNLREYVQQLEQSRLEFQAAMARLGDVLVSTHDIGGIIDVVLEACTLTLRANEAVFYERVAMPARIRATAASSWSVPDLELNGEGIAGSAARTLSPAIYPGEVPLADGEPDVGAAMAVPVVSDGRLFGVIAVYGRSGGGAFATEDVQTLQTLALQTEVAIGNIFLHDETKRQARTDGTTGLWNRREFELRALESVKEATRFEEPFGIILADIDDFKQVNDRFDHSTGDAALIWLASRLSDATREVDVVARWGGEEFIVLLPRAGIDEAARVAERIRVAVAAEPMVDGEKVIHLTVSAGYAVHPEDGTTTEQLFKAADSALLRAKRLGKNRVEPARPTEGAA